MSVAVTIPGWKAKEKGTAKKGTAKKGKAAKLAKPVTTKDDLSPVYITVFISSASTPQIVSINDNVPNGFHIQFQASGDRSYGPVALGLSSITSNASLVELPSGPADWKSQAIFSQENKGKGTVAVYFRHKESQAKPPVPPVPHIQFEVPIDTEVDGHIYRQTSRLRQRVQIINTSTKEEMVRVKLADNDSAPVKFAAKHAVKYEVIIQHQIDGQWKDNKSIGGIVDRVGGFDHLDIATEDDKDYDYNDSLVVLYWKNKEAKPPVPPVPHIQFEVPIDTEVDGHIYRQTSRLPQRVQIIDTSTKEEMVRAELADNDSAPVKFAAKHAVKYEVIIQHQIDGQWKDNKSIGGQWIVWEASTISTSPPRTTRTTTTTTA